MGRYADAYSFHLPTDVCKKLSAGHYKFSLTFAHDEPANGIRRRRVRLTQVYLKSSEPIPRRIR
jgi:hypothetical protein